ncbi:MAG: DUF1810 domain-containing protein [Gemmatimonadaceae bacterium]
MTPAVPESNDGSVQHGRDEFQLSRFEAAQAPVYPQVLGELRAGRKRTHWIWFVFPQVAGLGTSERSRRFALSGIDEATAYWRHPVLGARLRECARALLAHQDRSAASILGEIDALKLRSCATLFHEATGDPQFGELLRRFFDDQPDEATLRILGAPR